MALPFIVNTMDPRFPVLTMLAAACLAVSTIDSRAAPVNNPAATTAAAFNPESVPVTSRSLPAFPYVDWPEKLKPSLRKATQEDFDRAWFVAGAAPYSVEGRVDRRRFSPSQAKMSGLEIARNYEAALKELGAVRVDTMHPLDKNFPAENSSARNRFVKEKLRIYGDGIRYSTYLIRTTDKRIWIGVGVSRQIVQITTVEEKNMERSVALTKANEMKAALDKAGFIALYIHFDTDKAALRDDGKPAVNEIAKLLKDNPGLKISVEGHTDDSGDAKRNKVLSEQRASTIVAALKSSGIDAGRLKSAGFGSARPVADNRTEEGRARNRRVELVKT